MVEDFRDLTGLQLDALKEIGNIGAGNAATALAVMTRDRIDMSVPRVGILPFDQVAELVGGPDTVVVGVYFQVTGSAKCNILFLLSIEKAVLLAELLMGVPPSNKDTLGTMELSAVAEAGNIISSTYLNALAMFTKMTLIPSPPAVGVDMAGALLDGVLALYEEIGDYVLVLENKFRKGELDVIGHLFLLPEPEALDSILNALGVNY